MKLYDLEGDIGMECNRNIGKILSKIKFIAVIEQ